MAHHLPAQPTDEPSAQLGGSRIITRAEGCIIHDGDGNAMLDGMAGLWCVQVGYGREELAEAAYEQMLELPYYNTFFRTATPPTVMLAAKVAALLGPPLQPRVLQHLRLGGQRHPDPPGALLLAGARPAPAQDHHQPGQRLSRLDRRRRRAWAA